MKKNALKLILAGICLTLIFLNLSIATATQDGDGNEILPSNGYLNFGSASGTGGYGIRDNNGVIEFSGSGTTWGEVYGETQLSGTGSSAGSKLIGIEDLGGYFMGATIEDSLQELGATSVYSIQSIILDVGGSAVPDTATHSLQFTGSGALTTVKGLGTGSIIFEVAGEYDLANYPLFINYNDGSGSGYQIKGSSFGGGVDIMKIIASEDGQIVILDETNKDNDPGIPQTTYPRLRIYSDANWATVAQDQYLEFYHNQIGAFIVSGTGTLVIAPQHSYTQIGSTGGCTDTVGHDDVCLSGVTQVADRLVVDDELRVKSNAEILGSQTVTGTGIFNNGLITSGQPNQFQNYSIFSSGLESTGTGTFNNTLFAYNGIATSGASNEFSNYSHFGFAGVGIDGGLQVTGTGIFNNGLMVSGQPSQFNAFVSFNNEINVSGTGNYNGKSIFNDFVSMLDFASDYGTITDTLTISGNKSQNEVMTLNYDTGNGVGLIATGSGNIAFSSAGGVVNISSAPTPPSHPLITDSLFVGGAIELNGILYADSELQVSGTGTYNGLSYFNQNAYFGDDHRVIFGDSSDSGILWDAAQTNDSLMIGVGSSKTLIITDYSLLGTNLGFMNSPYPALVMTGTNIQTSPDQWVQLGFSPLGANFRSGSGSFVFELGPNALVTVSNLPPASPAHTLNTNSLWARGDLYAENNLYTDGNFNLSGTGTFGGAMVYNFTDVSAASYTLLSDDRYIGVSYTATGTGTITIPSDFISVCGWSIDIKDSGFNASVYPVVIETEGAETIDGNGSLSITTDGSAFTLISDCTNLLIY